MLYLRKYISESTLLGVWKIDESKDELLSSLDDHEHLDEILSMKSQSRILEMLAVRVLLKTLLNEEKKIGYLPSGKPYLIDHSYNISISHTRGYVTVALDRYHLIGLDIEHVSEKILKVKDRLLSEGEYIHQEDELVHLLLHWSAKEAMFKFLDAEGVDFKYHLFVDAFIPEDRGMFTASETRTNEMHRFDAYYWVRENFVLVCLVKKK